MITHAQLLDLVHYDPETGIFTLLKDGPRLKSGTVLNRDRLVPPSMTRQTAVYIPGHNHALAGRLAWFYTTGRWPDEEIDHDDTDGWNQRWVNLRQSSRAQNNANRRVFRNNRSGYKGVFYRAELGKWRAMISVDGKNKSIGHFDDPEAAGAAYADQAKLHFGEFARIS